MGFNSGFKGLTEAVSVALRDVNWDVGVLCCCGINAIHQQFFYTKEGGLLY